MIAEQVAACEKSLSSNFDLCKLFYMFAFVSMFDKNERLVSGS